MLSEALAELNWPVGNNRACPSPVMFVTRKELASHNLGFYPTNPSAGNALQEKWTRLIEDAVPEERRESQTCPNQLFRPLDLDRA
jgi:hypothetical protein